MAEQKIKTKDMRKIKFRIPHINRDGTFSHFSYWGAINHKGGHDLENNCFTSPSHSTNTSKKWHEQFTGLNDVNGNEIYEGDILEIEGDGIAVVKDSKGFFATRFLKGDILVIGHDVQSHNCKVIGNIHDNPELLDK